MRRSLGYPYNSAPGSESEDSQYMQLAVGIWDFFVGYLPPVSFESKLNLRKNSRALRTKRSGQRFISVKRIVDVFGALLLIVALSPVMLLAAVFVRATSKGSVLYRQQRVTAGSKCFEMLKFRSMYTDAEKTSGEVWCSANDSRVTPVGRILRRHHIDELPQLFNVLSGSMSLVGPRPERPCFSEMLNNQYPSFRCRLEVPAGITGLAQVRHGYCDSVEGYRRKLALDRLYVRHRSFGLDLAIAFRTVKIVFNGTERYV